MSIAMLLDEEAPSMLFVVMVLKNSDSANRNKHTKLYFFAVALTLSNTHFDIKNGSYFSWITLYATL
ncbi:hypothetical protein GCM10009112_26830 [Marinomonas arenicola]